MHFNPQQNAKKLHSHVHSALLITFLYDGKKAN